MSESLARLRESGFDPLWSGEVWRAVQFGEPYWLWLLPLLVLLLRWRIRPGPAPAVVYSSVELLRQASRPNRARRGYWPVVLRTLTVTLIVLALAQPRVEKDTREQKTEGIDLILVLDASRSMDSQDFDFAGRKVSRRAALEQVIAEFIAARPRDRIGLLGFAEKPFLISPLTLDHSWMMEALKEVRTSLGTAIGSAAEAAVDLLRQTDSANKVAIVVTDGLNTSGVDPLQSARTARRFGVRLYTIGVVSYADMRTRGVDRTMLSQMARTSGGQFFQATDGASLQAIYREIDRLERRELKQASLRAYRQLFPWFAAAACMLLLAELFIAQGRRMRLP